ncbi:exopolyphosphatase [Weissella oryzae SG25]|uniref:Exopolyphosphatase n=1 Tax=Weissella oryzae (strain DSM 25784 / JCM 18191 / LMG 30913 / SG25) TaxID=1329250 RepID=A0A069CY41_WEIOS|nr:Ppx/GppA family phosphatase [Weissella oryzae]GAK30011.1 exopolyphosphatase [Weissella oryzae SG25]
MTVIAIMDLGSNSTRMTISEIKEDASYQVLRREQSMVRLSEGMGADKILQPDAIDRTLKVMNEFKATAKEFNVDEIIATATAAVRQANNQAAFIDKMAKVTGLKLRVLAGIEEAHYDYLAIINTLPVQDTVIIDTGGGSVELVWVKDRVMQQAVSIPIGAVNLTEAYLEKDVVTAASLFKAMLAVETQLNNIPWLQFTRDLPIVALGGSNRTFAKISRRERQMMDLPIHGYILTSADLNDIFYRILGKNLNERRKVPGLGKERADIIVGGMLPLLMILRYIASGQVTFSQAGLREGLVFEFIAEHTKHTLVPPTPENMTIDDDRH